MKTKKKSGPPATNRKTAYTKDDNSLISITNTVNRNILLDQLLQEVIRRMADRSKTIASIEPVDDDKHHPVNVSEAVTAPLLKEVK